GGEEPGELDAIRRAASVTNAMFERLAEQPFVGRTEAELVWWIESTMHELGAEGAAFPPIVAAGPNGALPHADPGARTIEKGQTVVVDAAAEVQGHPSDRTQALASRPAA